MGFDYPRLIGELRDEERIRFYEILAHNLTVNARAILWDDRLSDAQKVEGVKWLNEMSHRVVLKSAAMRLGRDRFSEEDFWESMKHWMSQNPTAGGHAMWSVEASYRSCRG